MADRIVVEVPARAALAGNPSDLYGGAVLAVPVPSLRTRVELIRGPELAIIGHPDARHLVEAAATRAGITGEIRWTTTIPVAVGLAGSSALVIAVLRAAGPMDPLELALLAQAVERDDLGIRAGVQDRVVQAFERPVLVDASTEPPGVTPLVPARPVRVLVAWLPSAAGDSGVYHDALRASVDTAWMPALATAARRATDAFAAGDTDRLRVCMSGSSRTRSWAAPLSAEHDRLAAAVTDAGLVPNSAGSGGAVVAVVTDDHGLERAQAAVDVIGGASVIETYREER